MLKSIHQHMLPFRDAQCSLFPAKLTAVVSAPLAAWFKHPMRASPKHDVTILVKVGDGGMGHRCKGDRRKPGPTSFTFHWHLRTSSVLSLHGSDLSALH